MERLQPYLDVLRRWWWFPIMCALLAGGGGYLYTRQQQPVYAARVTLMVGTSLNNPSPDPQEIGLSRTLAQVYSEMVRRRPVLEQTLKRLNLDLAPEVLARAVETRVVFNASLLEIYVYDFSPERAAALANALAQTLIEQAPGARSLVDERFLQSQLADIQAKIEDVDQRVRDLRQRMERMNSAAELREAQDQLQALEQLKRDYQQTYAQLLSTINQGRVNTLTLLEPALPPTRPVSPNVLRNLVLSSGAGLLLSLSMLMVLELLMGRAVRWDGSLTMFSLPVLGAIPHWRNRKDPLIIRSAPDSPEAEAVRSLRLRILQLLEKDPSHVLLITSPMPEDGKSFVASNLAMAMVEAGVRTVLVEADLRGGTVAHLSPREIESGLVDYLEAEGELPDLEGLLIPIDGGLAILPLGRIPRDPGLLLSSPRWRLLLDQLRARYGVVMLDAPPTLFLAELEILARSADGVVLVIRDGETPRRLVGQARYALRGQRVLGIVVNDVPRRKLGLGYGYAYGRYRYPRRSSSTSAAPGVLQLWREGLAQRIQEWRAGRSASEPIAYPPAWPLPPRHERAAASSRWRRKPSLWSPPPPAPAASASPPSEHGERPEPAITSEEAVQKPTEESGAFLGSFLLEEEETTVLESSLAAQEEKRPAVQPFVEVDPELLKEALRELEAAGENEQPASADGVETPERSE
ncbi:MAG TPA: hypothetical protein VNK89_02360 [Thermoflexus sp.]|nr:hypothetical protein [Thermoflexus sp.]